MTVSEAGCDVGCETEAFAPCHQLKPTKYHNCTVTLEMQLTIISIMNSSENYFLDSLKTGCLLQFHTVQSDIANWHI